MREHGPSSPAASCNTCGRCLSLLVLELEKWFLRKQCCFNQRHINFKHATQIQHFPKRSWAPEATTACFSRPLRQGGSGQAGSAGPRPLATPTPAGRGLRGRVLSSPVPSIRYGCSRQPSRSHTAAESVTHGNEQPGAGHGGNCAISFSTSPQEPSQSLKERQRGAPPTTRRGICPPPPAPLADALSSRFCRSFLRDSNPHGAVLHGGQSLRPAASSSEELGHG